MEGKQGVGVVLHHRLFSGELRRANVNVGKVVGEVEETKEAGDEQVRAVG